MMLTPVIVVIITGINVLMTNRLRPVVLTITVFGFIAIHDVGLKLYAGGTHDGPGLGWMQLMLFIGLLPSYGLLIIGILKKKEFTRTEKTFSVLLFPLPIAGHLYLFNDLGLGRHYYY